MPTKQPPRLRTAMPARAQPTPDEGAHETIVRYRVLSSGISTPTGAIYRGALVTTDELGDTDRVARLLASRSIEVANGAD